MAADREMTGLGTLPHNGHFSKAEDRRFDATIVFVHYFGGNFESTRRHQKFVNELGFDAVTFDLDHNRDGWKMLRSAAGDALNGELELWSTAWKRQLKDILNSIAGPKIIYSLSTPSVAALKLIAEDHPHDVLAWITDCGPYLDARACIANYYRYRTSISSKLVPAFAALGSVLLGGFNYEKTVRSWVVQIPTSFPILSIRCGNDRLVPAPSIDRLFRANPLLNLKILELPGCAHLEGLKSHPEIYRPVVSQFLTAGLITGA